MLIELNKTAVVLKKQRRGANKLHKNSRVYSSCKHAYLTHSPMGVYDLCDVFQTPPKPLASAGDKLEQIIIIGKKKVKFALL